MILVFHVRGISDGPLKISASANPLDDELIASFESMLEASIALRLIPARISDNLNSGGALVQSRDGRWLDFRYADAWEKYVSWMQAKSIEA